MAILAERKTWKAQGRAGGRSPDLSDSEAANVRRALRFLRARHGGYRQLAAALKLRPSRVISLCGPKGRRPGASIALKVATLAQADAFEVLDGRYPKEGACPHCGRG